MLKELKKNRLNVSKILIFDYALFNSKDFNDNIRVFRCHYQKLFVDD